jgi:ABC-2 type transport system permease protein
MLDSLLRILALTRKELLAVLKDPRARLSMFLPPMIQLVVFGYAATYDLSDVPYAVLDQDHSAASRELLARLDGSGVFHRVADLHAAENVATFIDRRRAVLVIQIPQDFERRLQSSRAADLQVIADGRNSNTAGTASGYLATIVDAFNADWAAHHNGAGPVLTVTTRAWYNPNLETRWNMVPGLIGTLTMLQTLLLTAMSVAREREQGTFDQLLVTPFRPAEIMAGKSLPSILIGMVQATTIILVARFWFRIPLAGSLLPLYTGMCLFLLAAVGIGLLVSSVSATMQQAMLFGFTVIMPFTLLSGLTTPISAMPRALQYVTLANPLRYGVEIAQRVYLEGATLGRLWPDLWPLMILAGITLSAASWLFRHRLT